jgi:hypothetical protein
MDLERPGAEIARLPTNLQPFLGQGEGSVVVALVAAYLPELAEAERQAGSVPDLPLQ